ncbi:MAG: hypothetical protein WC390_06440 [Sulfurimonas sp.]
MLKLLENRYPNSHKIWAVAEKVKQGKFLWENQELINEIVVSTDTEGQIYSYNGVEFHQSTRQPFFDIQININPPVNDPLWCDKICCVEQCVLMAGFTSEDYYSLSEQDRKPHLTWNYPINKVFDKYIVIHTTAGYGQGNRRAPSQEWWNEFRKQYEDTKIVQIGHPNDSNLENVYDARNLSLFEQFQIILGASGGVFNDSGLAWAIGAIGTIPMVNLITYHLGQHSKNPAALAPEHWNNDKIDLFHPNSCSDIPHEDILSAIKELTK